MPNLATLICLLFIGCLLPACSDPNALLWNSLKNRDAISHPNLDAEPNPDKSITYEEYKQERQMLLKKQTTP